LPGGAGDRVGRITTGLGHRNGLRIGSSPSPGAVHAAEWRSKVPWWGTAVAAAAFRERSNGWMAEPFFRITNTVALLGWIVLLLLPGNRRVSGLLCATILPGGLAAAYAVVV